MFIVNTSRVKELRKQKQLSQQNLADALCIEQATYNKLENGKSHPSADLLFRLAKKLDVKVNELMMEINGVTIIKGNNHEVQITDLVSLPTDKLKLLQIQLQQSLQLIQALNEMQTN
ncbi:DNA-binding transcriptional regulator, XRE-family HTH domain [Mucilaginibacter lappiensis]|uniref:Transcriptional regulator with XRE-family HTH domain n=1 Tax=Mucilaginibacter lappiensis TaxID=354630 RepID=A0ABR6PHH4_9SPHI|nr:helix-turn-helix transcriptional regulator [Mucilaginibacter lappiensis]MBB6109219.1 transcriptional regulator with XRE-family HTH domain [Mucilaginibacter lappiensis]SIQ80609.1 DNA-binding transcriptional regulator, XRE-family HTH domain [Mucilaginibacter lappiensis]